MKIAISGKGGTGKTTISATMARLAARRGFDTLAIDCDSNPNLGVSLGLGFDVINEMEPLPKTTGALDRETVDRMLKEHVIGGPDGVVLLLAARVQQAGGG